MKKQLLFAFCCFPLFLSAQQSYQNPAAQQMLNKSSHNFFIENKGQWPKEVRYLAKIGGLNAWITNKGVVYDYYQFIRNYKPEESFKLPRNEKEEFERQHTSMKGHVVDMVLEGSNTEAKSVPSGMQDGYYNYFIGNNSTKWASFVRLYGEVLIQDIYPGIDIRYYFDNNLIRYDYIAKPGADLAQIKLKIKGSDGYKINEKGELTLKTSLGIITHGKLFAYQNIGNRKTEIACSFIKDRGGKIGVSAKNYDPALALVIDPLVYSTFLGASSQFDYVNSIIIDNVGNAIIAGETTSSDYPTTTGSYDVSYNAGYNDGIVTKLNAAGSALIYSTYIGGNGNDLCYSIAIDGNGNTYITGYTQSTNFPTTTGAFDVSFNGGSKDEDLFVTKLTPSGTALGYSTYIGGMGTETGYSIAVDGNGNAFVTGDTYSTNFPVTSGAFNETHDNFGWSDVFLTKINATGSALVYSTFIGGSSRDDGFSIAIDINGNAYVTGMTYSADYPITSGAYDTSHNGNQDIFVTKLNASGSALIYSTYIGGSNDDWGYSITYDTNGNTFITGQTASTNYPTTSGAFDVSFNGGSYGDLFITKLNASGKALVYSTYIGGSAEDKGSSIAIDSSGNAVVTGYTYSSDYPITNGAYDESQNGNSDALVSKLNASGSTLIYSTFFGGISSDEGTGLFVDESVNVFVTGKTWSNNFPVTMDAYDTSHYTPGYDIYVTKIPTIDPAININFTNVTSTTVNCSWSKGSGTKRAVFVKRTDNGTAIPKYNTTYTADNTFSMGSQIGTSGWYCVYNDTGSSVVINGLAPYANFRVMVCEYIGNVGNESYNMDSAKNNPNNFSTLIAPPTIQAHHIVFSNYAKNSVTASWINGNGSTRVVFISAGITGTASPSNNTTYTADTTFGSGTQIGSSGWYCILNGTGSKVNISGLSSNIAYKVMVCEYNGILSSELYDLNTSTNNPRNYDPIPTSQAYNISFSSATSNSISVSWTNGNGVKRAVFVILGNTGTVSPSNNVTYTADTNFGFGDQIGSTGWYCVYNGTASNLNISGLSSNTTYRVMVCEYNGSAGNEVYNTTTVTNNPNNATTLPVTPTIQASNISFSNIAPKTLTATCTKGNGTKRAFFIKAASTGSALPVNNTTYTANTIFGSGTQIGTSGWYCLYNDTGRTVNISGLQQNTNYTVMVCEYNGPTGSEQYNATTATNNPNSTKTTVGINEKQLSKINIYPNPTNGQFVVENAKDFRLTIINSLGETVYNSTVTDNSFAADLINVSDGVYFLKLEKEGKVFSEEIVLRR